MTSTERINRMKTALEGAEAVKAEIERRNEGDINPFRVSQREPLLQRATIEIRDTRKKIRDLEAAALAITLDADAVGKLDQLAERLDEAIKRNALIDLEMTTLTTVLNTVAQVRSTLG